MSEYWKSTPKYWCKHCKIFIRDTPFEKTQHEATGKHQGNLKRFLRDLHRNHEREERESKRAKDEVQRLTGLVSGTSTGGARSADLGRNRSSASTSNAPRQASIEERKNQMAQLADMGVTIPEEYRRDMALAGEWQTVSERKITPAEDEDPESSRLNVGIRKRKHEGDEDEEEAKGFDTNMRKGWGSATRHYPTAAMEDDDLDALLAKTKDIQRKDHVHSETKVEPEGREGVESTVTITTPESTETVKKEEPDENDTSKALGQQSAPQEALHGVVFKKRKNKAAKK